jgi:phage terminase small subunit
MGLTNKQRAFVMEYVKDFNATRAAVRAGYSERSAYSTGHDNLKKPEIAAAIQAAIDDRLMGKDEVRLRLADIARGDMGELMDITSMSFGLDLEAAKEKGLTKLIKKIRQTTTISSKGDEETERTVIDLELYDAQAALTTLGKHLRLFDENMNINGEVRLSGFDDLLKRVWGAGDGGA